MEPNNDKARKGTLESGKNSSKIIPNKGDKAIGSLINLLSHKDLASRIAAGKDLGTVFSTLSPDVKKQVVGYLVRRLDNGIDNVEIGFGFGTSGAVAVILMLASYQGASFASLLGMGFIESLGASGLLLAGVNGILGLAVSLLIFGLVYLGYKAFSASEHVNFCQAACTAIKGFSASLDSTQAAELLPHIQKLALNSGSNQEVQKIASDAQNALERVKVPTQIELVELNSNELKGTVVANEQLYSKKETSQKLDGDNAPDLSIKS